MSPLVTHSRQATWPFHWACGNKKLIVCCNTSPGRGCVHTHCWKQTFWVWEVNNLKSLWSVGTFCWRRSWFLCIIAQKRWSEFQGYTFRVRRVVQQRVCNLLESLKGNSGSYSGLRADLRGFFQCDIFKNEKRIPDFAEPWKYLTFLLIFTERLQLNDI